MGIEPTTTWLKSTRSTGWAKTAWWSFCETYYLIHFTLLAPPYHEAIVYSIVLHSQKLQTQNNDLLTMRMKLENYPPLQPNSTYLASLNYKNSSITKEMPETIKYEFNLRQFLCLYMSTTKMSTHSNNYFHHYSDKTDLPLSSYSTLMVNSFRPVTRSSTTHNLY